MIRKFVVTRTTYTKGVRVGTVAANALIQGGLHGMEDVRDESDDVAFVTIDAHPSQIEKAIEVMVEARLEVRDVKESS
jgi:hypothetical protein